MNEIKKGINLLAGKSNKTENEEKFAETEVKNQGMTFSRKERMDLAVETFENLMDNVLEVLKIIETPNIMEPKPTESNHVKKAREEVETLVTTVMEALKIIDDSITKELEDQIKEKKLKQEKESTKNKSNDKTEKVKQK
jgi:competence protein ComGC